MKKYALFIGRWQTWHKGHEWLIEQQLNKGNNCWIAIRDVQIDETNLKSAQEVLKVLPEAISKNKIAGEYMAVDYSRLVPLLIEAIKELDTKVEKK